MQKGAAFRADLTEAVHRGKTCRVDGDRTGHGQCAECNPGYGLTSEASCEIFTCTAGGHGRHRKGFCCKIWSRESQLFGRYRFIMPDMQGCGPKDKQEPVR